MERRKQPELYWEMDALCTATALHATVILTDQFTLMLVHVEFRAYLFYNISHLCLGPSDPIPLHSAIV